MTIKKTLKKAIDLLKLQNIEEPILKSKIILSNCMLKPKEYLLIHENEELSIDIEKDFFEKIDKLCNNVPLQYITNIQEFMGLEFYVDENVLIPRSDTEILVEEVINSIDKTKSIKLLDMCTGSGVIAVTLAKYCDNVKSLGKVYNNIQIVAVDKSEGALNVAIKNAKLNNVQEKIKFIKSDMFEKLDNLLLDSLYCGENVDNTSKNIKESTKNKIEKYDIIVSNPPYIETEVIKQLSKDVQNEPKIALDGGNDGLNFYRIISENLVKYLKKGGNLFLEIGYNQKESVSKIFEKKFEKLKCIKDFAGNDRVIVGENFDH